MVLSIAANAHAHAWKLEYGAIPVPARPGSQACGVPLDLAGLLAGEFVGRVESGWDQGDPVIQNERHCSPYCTACWTTVRAATTREGRGSRLPSVDVALDPWVLPNSISCKDKDDPVHRSHSHPQPIQPNTHSITQHHTIPNAGSRPYSYGNKSGHNGPGSLAGKGEK